MKALKFTLIAYIILEIPTFIVAAHFLGGGIVILLVLLTTLLGFYLLKRWQQWSMKLYMSRSPKEQMQAIREVSDLRRVVAAFLLVIPGFITDILGFILLCMHSNGSGQYQSGYDYYQKQDTNEDIIEGEYEEKK